MRTAAAAKPSTTIAAASMRGCSPLASISVSIREVMSGRTTDFQIMIAGIISETCGAALDRTRMGIDGCSVRGPFRSVLSRKASHGSARPGTDSRRAGTRRDKAGQGLLRLAGFGGGGRALRYYRHVGARARRLRQRRCRRGPLCGILPGLGLGISVRVDDAARGGAGACRGDRGASAGGETCSRRSARRRDPQLAGHRRGADRCRADLKRALAALEAIPRRQDAGAAR